jgi:hypothetical protein
MSSKRLGVLSCKFVHELNVIRVDFGWPSGGPDNLLSVVAQPQEVRDETEAWSDRPERAGRLVSLRDHGQRVVRATQTQATRFFNGFATHDTRYEDRLPPDKEGQSGTLQAGCRCHKVNELSFPVSQSARRWNGDAPTATITISPRCWTNSTIGSWPMARRLPAPRFPLSVSRIPIRATGRRWRDR